MDAVIISAIAALAGVLLGGVLSRSGEYRKWLRAEQHKAATELLAAGEALRRGVYTRRSVRKDAEATAKAKAEAVADVARLRVALEALRLVFPAPVVERAQDYVEISSAFSAIDVNAEVVVAQPQGYDFEYFDARNALSAAAALVIAPRGGLSPRTRYALNRSKTAAQLRSSENDQGE